MRLRRFPGGDCAGRKRARHVAGALLTIGLFVAGGQSGAGHSVGHFPSFYPDEIRIEALDPEAAAKRFREETLHAYVGAAPRFQGPPPAHVHSLKSLGSLLVLTAGRAGSRVECAAMQNVMASLRDGTAAGFVFHPYPITPYHSDYLHHLDRVEAAAGAAKAPAGRAAPQGIGARGRAAEAIVKARWGDVAADAEIVLEEIAVDEIVAGAGTRFDGWSGPPWVKEGWYQAHRVLAAHIDSPARRAADEIYEHLIRGETVGLVERVNLERRLVAALGEDCRRVVVGFTEREEFLDDAYPAGIENVAYDSLGGMNSPIFFRTVKLKEYPWNGKLQLAVRDRSVSAWNPVAGFTDPVGRMIWSAVGDPAAIQFPFNASWMPNRVQAGVARVEGQSGGIRVPSDSVVPRAGTGALEKAGVRSFASARVTYEVLASPYGDGSRMEFADLIYPFVFIYRWGEKSGDDDRFYEPGLADTFGTLRERLAGLKLVRVERTAHAVSEGMNILQETPVVELYLRNTPGDERQVSALAPPWSTVPWHLLALMEEAVGRGFAAFSAEEAARKGVPWLDLVRDASMRSRLLSLVEQFESESYRPDALKDFVSPSAAKTRWQSLREFVQANGHFLVANGPYRLTQWKQDEVVLRAVRELSYPLGFGTFDRFVNPPRAEIKSVDRTPEGIVVGVEAEMLVKGGRSYRLEKEALTRTTMRGTHGLLVVSRYLLIAPNGGVLAVDKMRWRDDGRFVIELPPALPPGNYTLLFAVFLDGNSTLPSARALRVTIGGAGAPG
jgi:hypothetical protein